MKNWRNPLWLWIFGLVYAGAFHWCYYYYLYAVWEYMGFTYLEPPFAMLLAGYGAASLGASFLPTLLERPSHLILWVIYLVVYVPSILVPVFLHLSSDSAVLELMGALLIGLAIISLMSRLRLRKVPFNPLPTKFFITPAIIFTLLLLVWVVIIYNGRFSLVSFDQVYENVRADAASIEAGTGVSYAVSWLSYFIFPLVMTLGLSRRNILLFLLSSAGLILMYSTSGLRSVAVSIITIPAFYYYFATHRRPSGYVIGLGLMSVLVGLTLLSLGTDIGEIPGLQTVLSLVLMRTAGITGYLTGLYYDFFQGHPLTYFTHLKFFTMAGVGAYDQQLGVVIARTYTQNTDVCMNANFWATDGVAALGLVGIPVISVVIGGIFHAIDVVSQRHRLEFVVASLIPIILLMCNISIFTTLLTGGLGFWLVAMSFMDPRVAYSKSTMSHSSVAGKIGQPAAIPFSRS